MAAEADQSSRSEFCVPRAWGSIEFSAPSVVSGGVVRLGVGDGTGTTATGSDAWAWATDDALWLSRGPLGGRPVYLAQVGSSWFAGTSLDVVRRSAGRDEPCDPFLASRMTWLYPPQSRLSLYEGVITLAPRDVVRIDAQGLQWMRREMPAVQSLGESGLSAEQYLWSNIVAAVGRALEGAKRPAFMISGGLDSSGVIAAASELGRLGDASGFLHWQFDGPCPDLPYVRAVADHFGVSLTLRPSTRWADAWPAALTLSGEPFSLLSGAGESDSLHAAVAAGADVLLTGFGGDESMGGLAQGVMADPSIRTSAALLRVAKLRMSWPTTVLERCMHYAIRPSLRARSPKAFRTWLRARSGAEMLPWIGDAARDVMQRSLLEESAVDDDLSTQEGRYARMTETPALAAFSELRAQTERDAGILRQDPLFDDRLVAAVASISPYVLYSDDMHRGLYRRCLTGRVPAMVAKRRDKAYFEHANGRAWLAARHKPEFAEIAQGRHLAERGLVQQRAFVDATRLLWDCDDPRELGLRLIKFWPAFAVEHFLSHRGR